MYWIDATTEIVPWVGGLRADLRAALPEVEFHTTTDEEPGGAVIRVEWTNRDGGRSGVALRWDASDSAPGEYFRGRLVRDVVRACARTEPKRDPLAVDPAGEVQGPALRRLLVDCLRTLAIANADPERLAYLALHAVVAGVEEARPFMRPGSA